MKKFKKVLSMWLALCMVLSVAVVAEGITANYTSSKVLVDGKEVAFEAYNINDNNYFKLRDIAMAISGTAKQFEIVWDEEKSEITIETGKAYTAVGGELAKGDGTQKSANNGAEYLLIDGEHKAVTAYNINGNNYFKLRDLGALLGFNVSWDGTNDCVIIDTNSLYVEPQPTQSEQEMTYVEITGEKDGKYVKYPDIPGFGSITGAPLYREAVQILEDGQEVTYYFYDCSDPQTDSTVNLFTIAMYSAGFVGNDTEGGLTVFERGNTLVLAGFEQFDTTPMIYIMITKRDEVLKSTEVTQPEMEETDKTMTFEKDGRYINFPDVPGFGSITGAPLYDEDTEVLDNGCKNAIYFYDCTDVDKEKLRAFSDAMEAAGFTVEQEFIDALKATDFNVVFNLDEFVMWTNGNLGVMGNGDRTIDGIPTYSISIRELK